MSPLGIHLAYRNVRRLRTIVTTLARHGFYPVMERLRLGGLVSLPERLLGRKRARERDAFTLPARARMAFEQLGPTFIKFGQILSTRPDIVPEEFVAEFLKLQDEVAPIPFEEVRAVIEEEFSRPAGELFESIDETPLAAASIAQVHRAVTTGGRDVVIKVQRPGLEEKITTDVAILRYMAGLLHRYVPESRLYDPVAIVDEFDVTVRREMDFSMEASFMERFRRNFADDPRVIIPKVCWSRTGRKVLTMDPVTGIKIDQVERLREAGMDTRKLARLLADVFFRQVFEFGLFHGDLHSGNIFVLSEERIALVDFGIVGRIDRQMQENLADIFIGIVKEDYERLTDVYLRLGILPEEIDEAAFRRDYQDILLHYFGRPLGAARLDDFLREYAKLSARYNIRMPRDLLLFDKCLMELEGLGRLLNPHQNIVAESEPYVKSLVKRRLSPETLAREGLETMREYKEFIERFPALSGQLLKKVLSDKMRVQFVHRGLEEFMGEMDRSSNRLTFGLIVAAMVVGSSMITASESGPTFMGYPVLGMVGFSIAAVLGLWLAFLIIRSGKY